MPIIISDDGSGNLIHSWQGAIVVLIVIVYLIQIAFVIGILIADYPREQFPAPYFRSKRQFFMHLIPFLWPIKTIIIAVANIGEDLDGKPKC